MLIDFDLSSNLLLNTYFQHNSRKRQLGSFPLPVVAEEAASNSARIYTLIGPLVCNSYFIILYTVSDCIC